MGQFQRRRQPVPPRRVEPFGLQPEPVPQAGLAVHLGDGVQGHASQVRRRGHGLHVYRTDHGGYRIDRGTRGRQRRSLPAVEVFCHDPSIYGKLPFHGGLDAIPPVRARRRRPAAVAAVVVPAAPAAAAPTFKVPFPCGQSWSGQTRTDHSPANAIDFNRTDDLGDPVVASAPGTVDRVTDLGNTSYGKYVRINHGGGYTTYYAHLNGFNVVRRPDRRLRHR